ncbi:aldehyde dehydrogenase family protein [Streptomyces sp. NPDC048636]|uniref:aldehyde dehydrogenase family protein n=1 Tax=Streptomyces sp. NPDC048636 TaxID=3155762 RepID=UPI00341A7281
MDKEVRQAIDRVFDLQRDYRWTAKVSSAAHRRSMLERLRAGVLRHADRAVEALYADLGKPSGDTQAHAEIHNIVDHIDRALEELESWMVPIDLGPSPDYPGASVRLEYEARGVVLIFGPWNFPLQLALQPLVPAIAAGNTAIVKPNEMCPETSKVTAAIIREAFDEQEVAAIEGGVDVADALLEKPIDHVFFTGSPTVGKVVMAAAAKHLASVTLELGGKCPGIVDGTTDLVEVAELVAEGRQYNSGQICLAVDHLWIREDLRDDFLRSYWEAVDRKHYRDGAFDQSTISRMVDKRNADRVQAYIDDAVARGAVLPRGGRATDGSGSFEPAVLLDVPLDARVMREEIFGPVLPVLTYRDIAEVTGFLQQGQKPLAMYIFSEDKEFVDTVLRGTSSGGVTVNGWASHWGDSALPFGGVNHSGLGSYHGLFGFKELSHERAILVHSGEDGKSARSAWDRRLIVPPATSVEPPSADR